MTITNNQINALRTEAGRAGGLEMVAICDAALTGDEGARATCAEVIAEAAAWADDDSDDSDDA